MSEKHRLPRLLYLSSELGEEVTRVPKLFRRFVPNLALYRAVAQDGISGAAASMDIPVDQLKRVRKRGKQGGDNRGKFVEEYRLLLALEIQEQLEEMDLLPREKLSILSDVNRFLEKAEDELVQVQQSSMSSIEGVHEIPKFKTGFGPLDIVLGDGGAYQGIIVFMGAPGTGKTSMMLSLLEAINRNLPETELFFFEMEIPMKLMQGRMSALNARTPFKDNDKLFTGSIPIEDVEQQLDEYSTTDDKIVFIDGPDAMPGLSSESRRIELGRIYRRLVKMKERSRLIVVSSQPNRQGHRNMTLASMAESWEKAWYADMVISLNVAGFQQMRFRCLKNRFGRGGNDVVFDYNLETLEWGNPLLEEEWT